MSAYKLNTVWILAKRELRSTIYGTGIYLAILVSLLISSIILQSFLRQVRVDRMLITVSPLAYPMFIATAVCTIYLAIASVTSISREKNMQTLELLFYGPVDYTTYVLSKYLKGVLSYVFIVAFLALYFFVVSISTNLGLSSEFPWVIFLSLLVSSCVITFGVLISTLAQSTRTSVLLFLGIIGGLIILQITHETLLKIDEASVPASLFYLGSTLSIINACVKWASPFYYLKEGMEAVSLESAEKYTSNVIFSIIYSAIALLLSIRVLKRKGVRKTTGE